MECQAIKMMGVLSQAWWHMPITPAMWETEVGESWSNVSPGKSMRPYLKNFKEVFLFIKRK
jgi:hypothetical protein